MVRTKDGRKTKKRTEHIIEQEFILEHNKAYGQMIREERLRRKISLDDLSCGIMSRTALERVSVCLNFMMIFHKIQYVELVEKCN